MGGIDIEEVAEQHPDQRRARRTSRTSWPSPDYQAKEVIASIGVTGSRAEPAHADPRAARAAVRRVRHDAGRDQPARRSSRTARSSPLDAHMDMENEARAAPEGAARRSSASATRRRARRARRRRSSSPARRSTRMDHRGVAGNVTEFDGNLGLVIGAGGGSLTLFDAVRAHGGKPANYCEIGGNPSVAKACGLAKLVLQKPGVDKIAVMMSIVSNTRVDIVARGVDQGLPRAGLRPGREDRDLPHPGRLGGRGLQDPREVRRRVLRPLGVDARGGATRRREDPGSGRMSILIDAGHDVHRPGHHRPRGRQPDARVPRLRRRREGRRRRDAGPQGPRRPRRAGVRHRRAGGRAPRRRRSTARSSPSRPRSPRTPCSRRSRTASS